MVLPPIPGTVGSEAAIQTVHRDKRRPSPGMWCTGRHNRPCHPQCEDGGLPQQWAVTTKSPTDDRARTQDQCLACRTIRGTIKVLSDCTEVGDSDLATDRLIENATGEEVTGCSPGASGVSVRPQWVPSKDRWRLAKRPVVKWCQQHQCPEQPAGPTRGTVAPN